MGEWKFNKQEIIIHKFNIYGLAANFLKYDNSFRNIRPDKKGKCELCDIPFVDGEYMTLALNKEKGGNLLICDDCRDKAIGNGVSCSYKQSG